VELPVITKHGSYWPKALEQVQYTIRYDSERIPKEIRARLDKWLLMLQPQSCPERLRLIVSIPPWRDIAVDEDGQHVNLAEKRARALAEECARDLQLWLEHLTVLFQGEQRQAFTFGLRLGQCLEAPQPFIDAALAALARLNEEQGNSTVLAAFLGGLQSRDPERVQWTLNAVAHDSALCHYLVDLTRLAKPTLSDLERILHLVHTGCIPSTALGAFYYGGVLDHLSSNDLITFTDQLLAFGSSGAWIALDLLFMYQLGASERWDECKQQFRKLLLHPNFHFVGELRELDLYHWQDVVSKLLEEEDHELARDLMQKIVVAGTAGRSHLDFEEACQPVLQSLLEHYQDTVWPLLSKALLSDDSLAVYYLTNQLGSRFKKEEKPSALFTLPDDCLLTWCDAHPTEVPAILARIMPLFHRQESVWTWRPFARTIIDRYGDQQAVLSALTSNLGTSAGCDIVAFYEKQTHLLEQLCNHHIPAVRRWAGEQLRYIQTQTEQEKAREDEWEIGIF
jgi:hypothetical protein